MRTTVHKEIKRFIRFLKWAIPYHGAGIILYHKDEEGLIRVLLGRRATRPGIGRWSVPGGGYEAKDGRIDGKRDLKAAAIRETREEISVEVKECSKIWSMHVIIFHWELFCAESEDMAIPDYNWEFQVLRWLPLDDLPKDILLFIRPQVKALRRRLGSKR